MPPKPPDGPVAILGVTGRVGRRLTLRLGDGWRGLARGNEPRRTLAAELGLGLSAVRWADRRDREAIREVLRGCAAVIDLCAFDADDVTPVRAALEQVAPDCERVLFASSMAAAPRDDAPLDAYGAGKRAAESAWRALGLPLATLHIGQLVDPRDTTGREAAWLQAWRAIGAPPPLRGTGAQRLQLTPIDGLVEVLVALRMLPVDALPTAPLPLVSPTAHTAAELVGALATGAGLPVEQIVFGGDARDGPFGGGDERVDTSATARALRLDDHAWRALWPDTLGALTALGRTVAEAHAAVASDNTQTGH